MPKAMKMQPDPGGPGLEADHRGCSKCDRARVGVRACIGAGRAAIRLRATWMIEVAHGPRRRTPTSVRLGPRSRTPTSIGGELPPHEQRDQVACEGRGDGASGVHRVPPRRLHVDRLHVQGVDHARGTRRCGRRSPKTRGSTRSMRTSSRVLLVREQGAVVGHEAVERQREQVQESSTHWQQHQHQRLPGTACAASDQHDRRQHQQQAGREHHRQITPRRRRLLSIVVVLGAASGGGAAPWQLRTMPDVGGRIR